MKVPKTLAIFLSPDRPKNQSEVSLRSGTTPSPLSLISDNIKSNRNNIKIHGG
jgi:hypothetical protein